MNIKNIGFLLIIIGVILVFYTGFNYVTTENVVNIGPIEINKQQNHAVKWTPIAGVVLIIGGVALVVQDKKN